MKTIELFSYGTLQHNDIQDTLFKRQLHGTSEALPGYKLGTISVPEDHHKAQLYFIAIYTGQSQDSIDGICYTINQDELPVVDEYEGTSYERVEVALKSGKKALVYRKPV